MLVSYPGAMRHSKPRPSLQPTDLAKLAVGKENALDAGSMKGFFKQQRQKRQSMGAPVMAHSLVCAEDPASQKPTTPTEARPMRKALSPRPVTASPLNVLNALTRSGTPPPPPPPPPPEPTMPAAAMETSPVAPMSVEKPAKAV